MLIAKRIAYLFTVLFLCSAFLFGCDHKEQKQEKKVETTQEKIGKEAALEIKKPIEEAAKVKARVEAKDKKKLEGC